MMSAPAVLLRLWERLERAGVWQAARDVLPDATIRLLDSYGAVLAATGESPSGARSARQELLDGLALEITTTDRRRTNGLLKVLALWFADSAEQESLRRELAAETLREYRHSGLVQRAAMGFAQTAGIDDILATLLGLCSIGDGQAVLDRHHHVLVAKGSLEEQEIFKLPPGVLERGKPLLERDMPGNWPHRLAYPLGEKKQYWLLMVSSADEKPFTSIDQHHISTLVAIASAALDRYQQQHLSETLLRYFPRPVAEALASPQQESGLAGKEVPATIMFVDICRFTSTTRELGAQATVALLNRYFEEMVLLVRKHRGFVDKFLGDGALAVFGIPDCRHAANDALEAAEDILQAVPKLPLDPPLSVRIGISSGPVISGNIGSFDRLDYTVIGNAVNESAKLLDISRRSGASLLLTGSTYAQLSEVAQRRVRKVDERLGEQAVYIGSNMD